MNLVHSFPRLTENLLFKLEEIVRHKFDYPSLPQDYKDFLLKHNGGHVSPGYIDDTDTIAHTEEVVFETPLKWIRDNNKPVTPCLVSFFVVWLEDMDESEVKDWEMLELVASNEHSKYDFEILPNQMMSIAKCSHPDCADMLCLSLSDEEYGAFYYNYGLSDHPANFHGDFYDKRIESILKKYDIDSYEQIEAHTKKGQKIIDEIKKAYFVKVADNFTTFLNNCKVVKIEQEN